MLVTLLLLAVLTINAVSAADNLTDSNDEVLQDTSLDEIEISDDADVISSTQDEIVKGTDNGTFTALQNKIDEAEENSTITLENDYTYDDGFSTDGIIIDKTLTIDGKGYTIDVTSQSRIFKINAGNVVLKNITFTNGYTSGNGGAIYNAGANFNVVSCAFNNCSASEYGGAIYNAGANFNVVSCAFNNCSASESDGGAIYHEMIDTNFTVYSYTFNNCSATGNGGDISFHESGHVYNSEFINCHAFDGAAIIGGSNVNCTFTNCTAEDNWEDVDILNKKYEIKFKDTINLKLTTVKVKKSAKKLVIKATLKINKKAVKGKQVTFKFNGKTYKAKTNKKGVAQITVKKAVLKKLKVGKKITYTAKYSTTTVKKTVKVKK